MERLTEAIRISKTVKDEIERRKVHPRQTADEILRPVLGLEEASG